MAKSLYQILSSYKSAESRNTLRDNDEELRILRTNICRLFGFPIPAGLSYLTTTQHLRQDLIAFLRDISSPVLSERSVPTNISNEDLVSKLNSMAIDKSSISPPVPSASPYDNNVIVRYNTQFTTPFSFTSEFRKSLELHLRLSSYSPPDQKLFFRSIVPKKYEQELINILDENSEISTLHLFDLLRKQINLKPERYLSNVQKLTSFKQGSMKSEDYYRHFTNLLADLDENLSDRLTASLFLNGLNSNLRTALMKGIVQV
jgi:hypothetical protein